MERAKGEGVDFSLRPGTLSGGFQVALEVKNLPASAEGIRGVCSTTGSGRSPGEGMATHSSILAWRMPWTDHGVANSQTQLFLRRKSVANLDSIRKKQRHPFANKGPHSQSYGFPISHVQM